MISLYADQKIWVRFFQLRSTGIMLVGLFTMVLITGSLPYCPENKSPKLSQKTSIIHYPLSYCPELMETRVQSYHKKTSIINIIWLKQGQCLASLNLTVHNKMAFKIAIRCCVGSDHTRMTTWVLFKVLLPSAVK